MWRVPRASDGTTQSGLAPYQPPTCLRSNRIVTSDRGDRVWQDRELARKFIEGMRGGVPFAAEQIDVMLRVIDAADVAIGHFVDLGCGDGILGRTLLDRYPNSYGVFIDFSEAMVEAAKKKLASQADRVQVVLGDFATASWLQCLGSQRGFNLVVSGYAIHHQTDERKRELYGEIFRLLTPGGMFLNMEHVASATAWAGQAFIDLMVDSLVRYHRQQGEDVGRDEVARRYVNRPDWSANILAPVESQCQWLRDLGYTDVDCYFKTFELALFGGRRPT
jgi:ubiquinone/menaquinone biosynthesis C-methylase UbiE